MWQKNVRYLDYNAGAGLTATVQRKLIDTLADGNLFWANPSSRHRLGQKIQQQLYLAHVQVSKTLNVTPDELVFTSSGTEANQTVIRSCLQEVDGVVIGSGDHSASFDLLEEIAQKHPRLPLQVSLPLLPTGHYDFSALRNSLTEAKTLGLKKILVSLFWANNETGVVTDLQALKKVIDESDVLVVLHLDGAQVWGKLSINAPSTPAHFITFSAHKIGAPAGTGVIWIRPGQNLHPLFLGEQARGRRGGTENSLGILATGFAADAINPQAFGKHTQMLRDHLESELLKSGLPIQIWGGEVERVSNTSRFSFTHFSTYQNWVELLDLKGFAVSHGSACRSNIIEPSRVLLNMGVDPGEALNSIRVSFGPENTIEDVNGLVEALVQIFERKKMSARSPEVPA